MVLNNAYLQHLRRALRQRSGAVQLVSTRTALKQVAAEHGRLLYRVPPTRNVRTRNVIAKSLIPDNPVHVSARDVVEAG